ncbi:MAG: ribosome biogenesis GTP-binding protein YihA/YsxC [Ruminobacter sp.]|nr:ribosome biogenesis GTP-binding protein YihA/YsxC [Ruminobacter sp.]
MINFSKTKFITSAPKLENLPADTGIEIAFVGRSNAGKSSALNAITNIKNLAKTSKTPGRTQLINLFEIEENKRIVDLPGYGFANVPIAVKNKWQKSLTEYLQKRKSLKVVVILMDIRHPLKDLDRQLITWATVANLHVLILLTKCDKLAINARNKAVYETKKNLIEFGCNYDIVAFSSLNKIGVIEVRELLDNYYNLLHTGEEITIEDSELQSFDENAWNKYSQEE